MHIILTAKSSIENDDGADAAETGIDSVSTKDHLQIESPKSTLLPPSNIPPRNADNITRQQNNLQRATSGTDDPFHNNSDSDTRSECSRVEDEAVRIKTEPQFQKLAVETQQTRQQSEADAPTSVACLDSKNSYDGDFTEFSTDDSEEETVEVKLEPHTYKQAKPVRRQETISNGCPCGDRPTAKLKQDQSDVTSAREKSEDIMWNSDDIQRLKLEIIVCPECNYVTSSEEDFIRHVTKTHSVVTGVLGAVST